MSKRPPVEPGAWHCGDEACGNINFARRTECNQCGLAKPKDPKLAVSNHSIGDDIAEKSKGLFSAADWACPKCGNVNWSRRTTCNVCNHNRAQVEGQRTGRGGGFSERDGVEYVKRDESDDEYDEFGRKKKKKQKFGQGGDLLAERPVSPVATEKQEAAEEREVEEEEDDDDGDLSKYQLDDEDDDDDDVDVSKYKLSDDEEEDKAQVAERPQRSRSPSAPRRKTSSRSRSPPRRRSTRSPSRSRSRDRRRSSRSARSRSRSRSPSRRKSRSPSRRSSGRSHSRDRRRSRSRSRSRSRRDSSRSYSSRH